MISNIKKLIFQGLIINNTNNYNKLSLIFKLSIEKAIIKLFI